jgi:hypothetical protein
MFDFSLECLECLWIGRIVLDSKTTTNKHLEGREFWEKDCAGKMIRVASAKRVIKETGSFGNWKEIPSINTSIPYLQ